MEKHKYLLNSLRDWLHGQGFEESDLEANSGRLQPDIVARKGNRLLIAETKVANVYRSRVFPALIGDTILRARASVIDADVMIALLLKRMSTKAMEDLESYAKDFLPELDWFLLDENGDGMANLDGQKIKFSQSPLPADSFSRKRGARSHSLFTPNNQWLLKMLLLPGINQKYWGGAKEKPRSIVSLAKAACVPQPSVSAFVSKFEDAGYIRRDKGMPVVVRHRELIDEWFYAAKNVSSKRIPVKHLYGDTPESLVRRIRGKDRRQGEPDMIISHHMACHLLGIGRSNVSVAWAYACTPSEIIMHQYELVEDMSSSPLFWLVPGKGKAVKSSWVLAEGIPVCDILQCYLDVRGSQARGQEQADYILNQILLPHFERRS